MTAGTDPGTPTPAHGVPTMVNDNHPPLFEKPEPKVVDVNSKPKPEEKSGKPPVQRVDYLAGFIGLSAILVTLNHFGLTFFPAVIEPTAPPHYSSEIWARKTFATFVFDALWIGPFLMISTRFLVSNYLRTGKLDNMAQKIVARPFRLLTPVASIALLEYFLMDSGATYYLEYLASVTWSTWPYTLIVANPGVFISQIIELAFLIPNAAPMITYTCESCGPMTPITSPQTHLCLRLYRCPLDHSCPASRRVADPSRFDHGERMQDALETICILRLLHVQPLVWTLMGFLLLRRSHACRPRPDL